MDYRKTRNRVHVRLTRDFNLFSVRRLRTLIAADVDDVRIDFAGARIVDSEAVRLLYELTRAGKRVTLVRPPEILAEVVDALGLSTVLDIGAMTQHTPDITEDVHDNRPV